MLLSILLTTQAIAFQYTQKSSYVLQTSFNATKTTAFSNLYLETENLSSVNTNRVLTDQQTENNTSKNDTVSSDTEGEKKDGILQRQKNKSDSRYAHPVFKTSQNIARVGTTLWLFGIPTVAVGGVSFILGAGMMTLEMKAAESLFNFGLVTGVVGLGMVTAGGGLIVAGNIAAAIAIRKLDIDVPRYGWWLVGGSLLVPALIQVAAPQLTGIGSVLGLGAPIGLIWQIRLNRKAYKEYVENNETALYTPPDNAVYNLQYK